MFAFDTTFGLIFLSVYIGSFIRYWTQFTAQRIFTFRSQLKLSHNGRKIMLMFTNKLSFNPPYMCTTFLNVNLSSIHIITHFPVPQVPIRTVYLFFSSQNVFLSLNISLDQPCGQHWSSFCTYLAWATGKVIRKSVFCSVIFLLFRFFFFFVFCFALFCFFFPHNHNAIST